jgi:hypothetical protein
MVITILVILVQLQDETDRGDGSLVFDVVDLWLASAGIEKFESTP